MNTSEDISAVITSYNQRGMVCEALNSVLMQTLKPKKVYIVDDGSSDMESINELHRIGKLKYDIHVEVIRTKTKGFRRLETSE